MFQNSKPYQSQLNIRENDLLSSPLSKSKDSNIFLDGLFQQKQIKTGQINEIEIKALVVGKENVGKSLFISKMIVETIYSNILTYLKVR